MEEQAEKKEKKVPFETIAKEFVGREGLTEGEAVDIAYNLKADIEEKTALLEGYKKLFKKTSEVGEQVIGGEGYVLLTKRANVSVEPGKLYGALEDVDLTDEFYSLISVKIADARKLLGVMIFSKIEKVGEPTIAVTIGKKK